MNRLLNAALQYAAKGWRVFPLHGIVNGRCTCGRSCSSPGKHPLLRRGLHDASIDQEVIHNWWRQWRRANIGIATGRASGIVVVDLDLPAAYASLPTLTDGEYGLACTLTALTGGGGVHLFYRHPGHDLGNSAGRLPGCPVELPGVDLRADGGYVVAPPSTHASASRYEWLDAAVPIAEVPPWLREPPRRLLPIAPAAVAFTGDGTRYGLKALRRQLDVLQHARVGERNHTLNRCAFVVAQYVAAGHLSESPAQAELARVALTIGLTVWETSGTIDSAFSGVWRRGGQLGQGRG